MKRFFDLFITLGLVPVWLPVMLFVGLMVSFKLGRPILFRQMRAGLHGKPFQMVKFRSMRNLSDTSGNPLADSERLTPFGNFLRAASLDELPELWNVIKGDMSLVGPRPLLLDYLPLYTAEQARRHEVRPGITGWGQVNGRNSLSWDEKFKLDIWYVEHYSLKLDIKILFLTVLRVIKRDGISPIDGIIMPRFTGTNDPKR